MTYLGVLFATIPSSHSARPVPLSHPNKQCGGVITYVKGNRGSLKGARARVLNGKRTNLSTLVAAKVQAVEGSERLLDGPRLYAGHTRFATTSKVGCLFLATFLCFCMRPFAVTACAEGAPNRENRGAV